jgi:EAL domain-containing protein (putative c-di-GMP-specific phosphodiesterase class I)
MSAPAQTQSELKWLRRAREALSGDGFALHAQPIVELSSGKVLRHELFLRMRDRRRVIDAGEFLGAVEEYGPIGEIDRWVVRSAVEAVAGGMRVNVNLSSESIDAGFARFVASELRARGADPSGLAFELRKSQLTQDPGSAAAFTGAVTKLGCELALDDIQAPAGGVDHLAGRFRYLKIDGQLTAKLVHDIADQRAVETIAQLARRYGQRTVAEQVEDVATLQVLEEFGVDEAQGFALGAPMPLQPPALAEAAVG